MNILITGGSGFIGSFLAKRLVLDAYNVVATLRGNKQLAESKLNLNFARVENISAETNWRNILDGVDTVIHTVARVHQMQESSEDPLTVYREANTFATKNLAEQAKAAGVKHFIFLSSIKVNGESTSSKPFDEQDTPNPLDPYGLSKLEAEQALIEVCKNSDMRYTILRLPLVYGVGVKANFASLVKLVRKGWPLPLGSVYNKRSMLYLGNFISIIRECLVNANCFDQTFCLSDANDVSTTDLIRYIAMAYQSKTKLLPVPAVFFRLLGKLTGKSATIKRLFGSLQVNSGKLRKTLDWSPPYTVESALVEMAQQEKSTGV
jgi:nucleoside-diphosphate-sugar epimerase